MSLSSWDCISSPLESNRTDKEEESDHPPNPVLEET